MTLLWINLGLVFLLALVSRYFSTPVVAGGYTITVKPNKLLVFGSMAALVAVSGLRANIGDTYFYKHIYESTDFSWAYIFDEKDIGFGILQKGLKTLSDDPQILILTTALLTNVLIVIVLYHYSRKIELSLFVYITGGLFLISMNGMRQMLAAAIAFTAIKFLMEGKFLKYALVVVAASFFHQSALILLPIYFLVRVRAWSKATLVLMVVSVVIAIGFDYFSALLFSALGDSQYGHYRNFDEGGANIIRVAVNAAPLFIAYLGRDKLRRVFPKSDYVVNMVLIGFIFMVIATQNWIFARFALYFNLYQLILIAWIIKVFRERDQAFMYYVILACYLGYYFYENVITLNIQYRSDFFMW
ncbi:Transmembrane protein EpsG [Lentibacillus sp. JNUCC-1]|uniref:EpsG family protein n=1 Tax=Lentibacillus sp. JNUCC-1 TaxID=2654513 RepID=UPI0012E79CFD|nr:EpsG family protein [Lentibacillus sp. JNUCC-1]MUV36920.1 Transmembrane protein EpsG [Lentibacillus sp. JNUCC-1]